MESTLTYYQESGLLLKEIEHDIMFMESIDPVDLFFEAEDANAKANVEASKKLTEGIIAKLKKVIESLCNMIKTVVEKITDFFKKRFLNEDEKKVYDQLRAFINENPELKGKKIKIKDVKEITKKYDEALKMVDKGIADMQAKDAETVAEIRQRTESAVNNLINGVAGSVSAVVAADLAVRIAETNTDNAKLVQKALNSELGLLQKLESQIGKERTADLQKRVNSLSNMASLRRLKISLFQRKYKGIASAVDATFNDFGAIIKTDMSLKANLKRFTKFRILDDVLGAWNTHTGSNETKLSVAKKGAKVGYKVHKTVKHIRNEVNDFLGTDLGSKSRRNASANDRTTTDMYNERQRAKAEKRAKRDKEFEKARRNLMS